MSVERQLVEQLVGEAITKAQEVKDDPRQRDIVTFWTRLAAGVIYALGEIDNDLWFLMETINKEVADAAIILGQSPDDLESLDTPGVAEMSGQQVRDRITDQLRAAEHTLNSSTSLTDTDKLTLGIAFSLGKALVLQLRELNDDECHLKSATRAGFGTLGALLGSR